MPSPPSPDDALSLEKEGLQRRMSVVRAQWLRQMQASSFEIKANLVYIVRSRPVGPTHTHKKISSHTQRMMFIYSKSFS